MKPLGFAIAASIALTSVMLPVLQATAAEESTGAHSPAWNLGYADALAGKFENSDSSAEEPRRFENPYAPQEDPLNNTDYICGYIAGKSMRNSNAP